jgi:hypothetical protein
LFVTRINEEQRLECTSAPMFRLSLHRAREREKQRETESISHLSSLSPALSLIPSFSRSLSLSRSLALPLPRTEFSHAFRRFSMPPLTPHASFICYLENCFSLYALSFHRQYRSVRHREGGIVAVDDQSGVHLGKNAVHKSS